MKLSLTSCKAAHLPGFEEKLSRTIMGLNAVLDEARSLEVSESRAGEIDSVCSGASGGGSMQFLSTEAANPKTQNN